MAWPVARGTEDFGTARHGGEMARGFLARHGTPVVRHAGGTARTWHGMEWANMARHGSE